MKANERYEMCGQLAAGFPTFIEITSVTCEMIVHAEVQEVDGAVIRFTSMHASDLVAAIERGWLVAVTQTEGEG